jgi:hypothetical protein
VKGYIDTSIGTVRGWSASGISAPEGDPDQADALHHQKSRGSLDKGMPQALERKYHSDLTRFLLKMRNALDRRSRHGT